VEESPNRFFNEARCPVCHRLLDPTVLKAQCSHCLNAVYAKHLMSGETMTGGRQFELVADSRRRKHIVFQLDSNWAYCGERRLSRLPGNRKKVSFEDIPQGICAGCSAVLNQLRADHPVHSEG